MDNKLISVIIPCYNHEKYIRKTVMSALNQTYSNVEVLVADDCSTDGSVSILRSIKDPRLKTFFFEKNHGTVYTLNFLLSQASGEYIAALGSDDIFAPDKLEKQLAVMESDSSLGAVFSWVKLIDENSNPYTSGDSIPLTIFNEPNRTQGQWLHYFFTDLNHLCHPSSMVRRQVHEELGLYHAAYRQLHDFDFWVRLVAKYPIHVIPEQLVYYRRERNCASVSAPTVANTMRVYNELNSIWLQVFKTLDKNIFLDAFSDFLEDTEIADEESLAISKYLVLRQLKSGDQSLRSASLEYFTEYIDTISFSSAANTKKYDLLKIYYADSAKASMEYPISLELLEQVSPDFYAWHNAQMDATRTALNNALNSLSWKVTKPLRSLSALLRKR